MARKNFQFEKFKREMAQQKKREDKRRLKQEQRSKKTQEIPGAVPEAVDVVPTKSGTE